MTDETTARDRVEVVERALKMQEGSVLAREVLRLRALAGAPTAGVAVRHGVTPEPPAGSEHFREGWRTGYEQRGIDTARTAAPEGVDAADELDDRCPYCGRYCICGRLVEDDDGMDLEAQGEMADQLAAAQAAIQRVRPAVREALRLLDDWQTAEELGTVEEWAVQISETLRALDGDTTEEKR